MIWYRSHLSALAILSCVLFGCQGPATDNTVAAAATQVDQQHDEDGGGIIETMSGLVDKAKAQAKARTPSMKDMEKMFGDVGETTSQTADESMEWVQETFQTLSDHGMTSAKNAGDWLKNDWNSMNTWEYQVLAVTAEEISATPASLEKTLNAAGAQRWECFSVSESPQGLKFFMKRQKKSYLKNVPLKDMMKLVPLLDNNE